MPTSSSPSRTRFTPAAVTLALLIALNLLNYIDRYILPGEVTLIQRDFHWTDKQMGLLTTALFAVYMCVAPLTGWLGDHFRRKPLIIGGAVLWSLATLGTAWVHDYRSMFIRHTLVGARGARFHVALERRLVLLGELPRAKEIDLPAALAKPLHTSIP